MSVISLTMALALAAQTTSYSVDEDASLLVARLYKAGIASPLAHEHVVRASEASGRIVTSPENLTQTRVEVVVPVAGLRADEPEMRERFGLDRAMSDEDRREIQSTMLSPIQLDAQRHPMIRFAASSLEPLGGNRYRVSGELTLHGQTRPVAVPVTVELRGDTMRVQGQLDILQTDFGIEPYSAAFGAIQNQDRVTLIFDLVARATAPG